jgi:tetratricopeptide (TPR) repeat protein
MRAWIFALTAILVVLLPCAAGAGAYDDCYGEDIERRITGCTELIEGRDPEIATAHAMRGLAYSIKGQYERAIADFDVAIRLKPDFSATLNNRAWAYFQWGKTREGLPDVEKSIELNPSSPYAYDTRAHMRQALGDAAAALRDYDRALFYGGTRVAKLYQCGLAQRGLYSGAVDGIGGPELLQALEKCAAVRDCDPLPPNEKCP